MAVREGPTTLTRKVAYAGMHDRTPEMRVLYVTPGVCEALEYTQREMLGKPAYTFVANVDAAEYRESFGTQTDDNVSIMYIYLQPKHSAKYLARVINFSCDNASFNIIFECQGATLPSYRLENRKIQKFKCMLDRHQRSTEQHTSEVDDDMLKDMGGSQDRRVDCGPCDTSTIYSTNTITRQACLILEDIDGDRGRNAYLGPRIVFATNGFSQIVAADVCDIQGTCLLSLVATEDITKAAEFLQKASQTNNIVLETLVMWASPLEGVGVESADRSGLPRVSVEFMALGADNCIAVLCQLAKSSMVQSGAVDEYAAGYLSLEDIISSEPDTSDCPSFWKRH